jgi:hypothetical protein
MIAVTALQGKVGTVPTARDHRANSASRRDLGNRWLMPGSFQYCDTLAVMQTSTVMASGTTIQSSQATKIVGS